MPRSSSPVDRAAQKSRARDERQRRDDDRCERHADRKEKYSSHRHSDKDRNDERKRYHESTKNESSSRHSRRYGNYERDVKSEEERRRRRRRERERERERDERERDEGRHRKHRHHHRYDSDRLKRSEDKEKEAEKRAKAAETLLYATETDPLHEDFRRETGLAPSTGFTWAKKAEKERKMGITPAEAKRRDEDRRREAEEEIQRLNKRREERERDQAVREEEEARMARLQESEAMAEWVAREDEFYLEQSRKRAVIRVRENRAKPIDLLAINLKWVNPPSVGQSDGQKYKVDAQLHPAHAQTADYNDDDDLDLDIDLEEPYLLFDDLDLKETEELHQDIQMYLSLEKDEQNLDFWRSMLVVCDNMLSELRLADGQASNEAGIRANIDPSVKADMDAMLSTKTYEQLLDLQDQVRSKLQSGEPIDVEYWEGLLRAIVVWRAKAKLRDMHEVILSNRIEHLRQRQRIEAERRERLGLPTIEEERMAKANEAARKRAEREAAGASMLDESASAADLFAREAAKALEEGEEVFATTDEDLRSVNEMAAATSSLEATAAGGGAHYSLEDKYRPRKPRYFNKVHTGYEWNKYNRTHYDVDNPPPKQVQGYKFNIFYPDLIDKSKPPTFRIVKDRVDDGETCLIIFEAGPPYETIGFRIVNKPWNMSHQRGFRAVFERGILQLYFNFQRMFYRK